MVSKNITGRLRLLIVVTSVAITAGLALITHQMTEMQSRDDFEALANDSRAALVARMGNYLLSLEGLAGFHAASKNATEDEWSRYVDNLSIEKSLPGVTGLGLIVPVLERDIATFTREASKELSGEFTIRPTTDFAEKFVIRFIVPMAANGPARGLDIAFEERRRTAAALARDTGTPQVTAPIELVQDDVKQAGFLILRPVYGSDLAPDTVAERRAKLTGWTYAPFIGERLLKNLTPSQNQMFTIQVSDAAAENGQIYNNRPTAEDGGGEFTSVKNIPMFGREWTMTLYSTPTFEMNRNNNTALIVLLSGLALTWILSRYLRLASEREQDVHALVAQQSRKLTDEEEQNRAIVQNSLFGVVLLDHAGLVLTANAAAGSILQVSPDAMTGEYLTKFLPEDTLTGDWQVLKTTCPVGQNSEVVHLEMQRKLWKTAQGEGRQSIILRDISDEVKSEGALKANEERWNLALQGADIGVYDINLVDGTSIVSNTWRRLMKAPPESELPHTQDYFFERIHPDDMDRLLESDRACIMGEADSSVSEIRVRIGKSGWRWMRSYAVIVERDSAGKALRMVGAQTDVTALRVAREALHQSEERFRLVLSSAPVGMAILDENGILNDSNGALMQMIGERDDATSTLRLTDLFDPKEAESIVTAISTLHGDTQGTYLGEHIILHNDGSTRWGLVKVAWAYDATSESEIYIVQINDITQQKEAERIKTEFVATVSHELRTPLTSIKGALGLLETVMIGSTLPSATRLVEIASGNTNRLIYLVNDILDLEKMTAGKLEFRIRNYTAADLVTLSIDQSRPFADSEGVKVTLDDRSEMAQVMVDEDRISQVLNNLLSNACKYAPTDTPVTLRIERDGDMLRLGVTDQGAGVPVAFHNRIFQAFSQADSSDTRQKGGTGLGLNISRLIVEQMGGEIGFDSEPDVATTFWFTVPLAQGTRAPNPDAHGTPDRKTTRRILHLEDDEDFAEVIRISLSNEASVESASTMSAARAKLRDGHYDLVLLDWNLPDGDGSELLAEIRTHQPTTRIVSLSSSEQMPGDPFVDLSLTKSRDALSSIVATLKSEMTSTDAA